MLGAWDTEVASRTLQSFVPSSLVMPLTIVLVSHGCCSKLGQTSWLKTTCIYYLFWRTEV